MQKCRRGLGENIPGDSSWPFPVLSGLSGVLDLSLTSHLHLHLSPPLLLSPLFLFSFRWLLSWAPVSFFFDSPRFVGPNCYCIFLNCIRISWKETLYILLNYERKGYTFACKLFPSPCHAIDCTRGLRWSVLICLDPSLLHTDPARLDCSISCIAHLSTLSPTPIYSVNPHYS